LHNYGSQSGYMTKIRMFPKQNMNSFLSKASFY
jgi:hypothetical protein